MELPSLDSLGLLFVFVWPGLLALLVYRWIMPVDRLDWKEAVPKGLFFSVINYLIFFPAALVVIQPANLEDRAWLYWFSLLVLLIIGPILLALGFKYAFKLPILRGIIQAPYPTAWDFFFARRERVFVLVHLKNGRMLGGYWTEGSYASAFPYSGDLYVARTCKIDKDGHFLDYIDSSRGFLIRRDEFSHIEFFSEGDRAQAEVHDDRREKAAE